MMMTGPVELEYEGEFALEGDVLRFPDPPTCAAAR
jgi:hypothetical protein